METKRMTVLNTIFLPCGSTAHFDGDFSYRCDSCFAVVGSMGQFRTIQKIHQPNHRVKEHTMVTKVRNDFKVYEEVTTLGKTLWRIRIGGRKGDMVTSCNSVEQAAEVARQLNLDPWYLG